MQPTSRLARELCYCDKKMRGNSVYYYGTKLAPFW